MIHTHTRFKIIFCMSISPKFPSLVSHHSNYHSVIPLKKTYLNDSQQKNQKGQCLNSIWRDLNVMLNLSCYVLPIRMRLMLAAKFTYFLRCLLCFQIATFVNNFNSHFGRNKNNIFVGSISLGGIAAQYFSISCWHLAGKNANPKAFEDSIRHEAISFCNMDKSN